MHKIEWYFLLNAISPFGLTSITNTAHLLLLIHELLERIFQIPSFEEKNRHPIKALYIMTKTLPNQLTV